MELLINILSQFGLGFAAILVYNLIAFRKYLIDKNIREDINKRVFWDALWNDSKFIWLWSMLVILILSLLINIMPDLADLIKNEFGWDISGEIKSFFLLGLGLSAGFDKNKR